MSFTQNISELNTNEHLRFKENDLINYNHEYEKECEINFIKSFGDNGFIFTDQKSIDSQRSVLGYLIKSIGHNLVNGTSVMNISLPISIFDSRSILDNFAYQHRQFEYFMDKACEETKPPNRLKWVSIKY